MTTHSTATTSPIPRAARTGIKSGFGDVISPTLNPRRPQVRRIAIGTATAAVVVGSVFGTIGPSSNVSAGGAYSDHPLLVCDTTGCLISSHWLRDSDGDGVSDADEIAAGTDPHDAASRPLLSTLIDLAFYGELPSYGSMMSEIIVLPADPSKALSVDPTNGVFAPKELGDTLTRLGVKPEHAATASLYGSGLLVSMEQPTKPGTRPAGARMDPMTLISATDGGTTIATKAFQTDTSVSNNSTVWKPDGGSSSTETTYDKATGENLGTTTCNNGKCHSSTEDRTVFDDIYDFFFGSYINPEADSEVVITPQLFEQVVARLGNNSTPANPDGATIDLEGLAKLIEERGNGVILVNPDYAEVVVTTPNASSTAQPRTAPGWDPPMADIDPSGSPTNPTGAPNTGDKP